MSTLYVDNIVPNLGSQVQIPQLKPLAGSVVQVSQSYKTDIFTTTSTGYVDVTGLSVSMLPSSNSSKFLIQVNLNAGILGNAGGIQLFRNGSVIGLPNSIGGKNNRFWLNIYNGGDDANSTPNWGMSYLDSPATSSTVTYSVRCACVQGGGTIVVNDQTSQVTNQTYAGNSVSHITVMEIAQ